MNRKNLFILSALFFAFILFNSCESTKQTAFVELTPEQKMFVGTWSEINRDGNIETIVLTEEGTIHSTTVTQDGSLIEEDKGYFSFVEDQLKVSITSAKGNWTNWEFERISPPVYMFYNYTITESMIHLERTRKIFYDSIQDFEEPYPEDNYSRMK